MALPRLHIEGRRLVDERGRRVLLRRMVVPTENSESAEKSRGLKFAAVVSPAC